MSHEDAWNTTTVKLVKASEVILIYNFIFMVYIIIYIKCTYIAVICFRLIAEHL